MRSPVPTGTVDLVTTTTGPLQDFGKLPDRLENVSQVGMAVAAARRSSDSNEDRLRPFDALGQIGREAEPPALDIGLHQGLRGPAPRSA